MHHGYESLTRRSDTPVADADIHEPVATGVATTPHGKRPRLSLSADPGPGGSLATRTAAIPSPEQIFNFHPNGPSEWRSPVILDPNDGPLTREVRHTAQELKEYLASEKATDDKAAKSRPCSETDVAARKPGCPEGQNGARASVLNTQQDKAAVQ